MKVLTYVPVMETVQPKTLVLVLKDIRDLCARVTFASVYPVMIQQYVVAKEIVLPQMYASVMMGTQVTIAVLQDIATEWYFQTSQFVLEMEYVYSRNLAIVILDMVVTTVNILTASVLLATNLQCALAMEHVQMSTTVIAPMSIRDSTAVLQELVQMFSSMIQVFVQVMECAVVKMSVLALLDTQDSTVNNPFVSILKVTMQLFAVEKEFAPIQIVVSVKKDIQEVIVQLFEHAMA